MQTTDTQEHQQIVPVTPSKPPRSGCFWGFAGMAGCLIFVLALVAIVVIGFPALVGNVINAAVSPFQRQQPAVANVASTQTIIQRVQPLGQLVSISTQLAKADIQVSVEQGALNACGYGANHVVQGAVEAGIDMMALSEDDLVYDQASDRYILTLPSPQLTSCRIDYIRQYDTTTTACSIDWDEARLIANYMALTDFRDEQIEAGILERAKQETRLVLTNFIQLLTDKPVEIRFEDAVGAPVFPASCQPPAPQGWVYNADRNVWIKP